jgi:hypothetical protein
MSPERFDNHLADLRRRVRGVLLTHGASWLAAVVIGSVLAECVGDWLFHFDDPILRLILGLAIAGAAVWSVRKFLWTPLSARLSDIDLALRIEDRYPGFQDSLSSSVQFARSGADPRIGSPQLQQAVVATTLGRLEGLDCTDVVDFRPVRQMTLIALGVCLATMLLAGIFRPQSSIALRRLLNPFSGPGWPRETNLRLLREDLAPLEFGPDRALRVARGDMLKVVAENALGHLPARVTLEYRLADRKVTSETMRPMTMQDGQGVRREVGLGQLPSTKDDLEFRVVGGDDDQMAWHRVLIVPPPAVEKLQVTITPPAYTGRPAERLPGGVGHVQGLVGSRVAIAASVNKPIRQAMLRAKDQGRAQVKLDTAGRQLETSFIIRNAGVHSWWLELQDMQGFEDGEPPRYEVRGVSDAEPEIEIDLPAADIQATADALVLVRTTARDDLGLAEIRLVFKLESLPVPRDQSENGPVSSDGTRPEHTIVLLGGVDRPLTYSAEYDWKLADLALSPGARITFHTEATDDFDLTPEFGPGQAPPPHVGRSVMRTLTIVSREEKSQEIAQRQEGLLADLERSYKLQQQARSQVDDLVVQLETVQKFRPEDLDTLQRSELGQREVAAQLNHPVSGLAQRARELSAELLNNQISDPQSERRLNRIADELARIGLENLVPIEQELTQARKLLQSPGPWNNGPGNDTTSNAVKDAKRDPADRPERALHQVSANQAAVLESIGEMLQDLAQWRQEHDAAQELADLIRQQSDLNQRSAELAQRTLTRPSDQLTSQERADLGKVAERQNKQARQLEQLESRMRSTIDNLTHEDARAAAALKDAADQSQHGGIAAQMRDAAVEIGENRMGQATRSQQEILQKLRDLDDVLRHNRESDSEMLVKKLKQAESELKDLRDRQADLLHKLHDAGGTAASPERQQQLESLSEAQKVLQDETARLSRRLARLEARKAGASAERAAARMQKSQDQLDEGDGAEAAGQQQEALDDLEQAQRELARRRREEEETLARENLARVADELAGLIPRQQAAIDETKRLNDLHESSGKWPRSGLVSLRGLTQAQRDLMDDTDRVAQKLSAAEVFALALKGAVSQMRRAADWLADRQTGSETQYAQEASRRRLIELVEALKPDPPGSSEGEPAPEQEGGSSGRQQGPPTDGIPTLAQIKMLISLQKELSSRTNQIEQLRGRDGRLPQSAHDEIESIAREQGELADLVRNLSSVASDDDSAMGDSETKPSDENERPE